jgi:hypothetical protein
MMLPARGSFVRFVPFSRYMQEIDCLSQPGFILAFGGEVVERERFKQAGFEVL